MAGHNILINRAPVLTLWATTVAERLGFDQDEALTLGKAVAGLTAQSNRTRKWNVNDPIVMHMADFRVCEAELTTSKTM
jgi:hypothetical protein